MVGSIIRLELSDCDVETELSELSAEQVIFIAIGGSGYYRSLSLSLCFTQNSLEKIPNVLSCSSVSISYQTNT